MQKLVSLQQVSTITVSMGSGAKKLKTLIVGDNCTVTINDQAALLTQLAVGDELKTSGDPVTGIVVHREENS
jgi:hypothetical protein